MTTFVVGSGVGDNYATLLLSMPDVSWMKAAVMGSLYELTKEGNWREEGDVAVSFAVEESSQMVAGYSFLHFNPFPVGMIIAWSVETNPPGYLTCDGSDYSITAYPELFEVIGDYWGFDGDTGYLPDLRGRTIISDDETHPFSDIGGVETTIMTVPQMPNHSHTDNGHVHTIPLTATTLAVEPGEVTVLTPVPLFTQDTGISYADITYEGADEPQDNMQPYLVLRYLIYAGRI